jgi:Flp pilus assembly protein TadD
MNEGESQYYSNRSKCYQKQGNFFLALKDAEAACELNESNIKAHYICGCILAELGKFDDSKLSKAENRLKKGSYPII